jgi:hypothetical protein
MSTPTHGVEHLIHAGNQPLVFAKSGRSGSGNWKSGIQTFGIRWHRSPFKITMDLSFAHSASNRWILVTLWRLLPSQFGDNPGQVPLAKHARPFNGLHGCNVFSKINLVKGYHQIPVAAADIP